MLKAKNIVIIFVLNYLLILLVCCLLEIIFISNHAQQAQLLMRTAADMALEQVQATDDFFVTGGGYLLEDSKSYKLHVCTGSTFEKVDLFPAFTGVEGGSAESSVESIYKKLYGGGKMTEFINDSLSNGSSVLSLSFVAGYTQPPFTYEMPISVPIDTDGDGLADSTETITIEDSSNILTTNWYYVPKIFQMGNDITGLSSIDYIDFTKDLNAVYKNQVVGGKYESSKDTDIAGIWNMYELNNSKKTTYKYTSGAATGTPVSYYFTPISLGITYINEELLQALFVNNIDLLMRSKYMNFGTYDLNSEDCGNGVLRGAFYPELADTESLNDWNPINNGAFTFLRGEKISGTAYGAQLFEGTVKPKIEYIVIDMYNNDSVNNEVLQQVLGPRFTNDTLNSSYFTDSATAVNYAGQTITGSLLRQIDEKAIDTYEQIIYGVPKSNSPIDHKPMVVAKVTFYADFIIPYSTVSLREMRGREADNNISGRLLFDAFANSPTDGKSHIDDNYVDLEIRTLMVANGAEGWDTIYPDDYYDDIGMKVNRLNGNYHSDAMSYTTYFAVTP